MMDEYRLEAVKPVADFDRLTHAYILTGSGARHLASRMSSAVVCSADSGRPCGLCRHCRKALAGIHPDIINIAPQDGKAGILVGQARSLRADAYVVPNEADRKVYIIDPADKMNAQAQNALLKIIEEPPPAVTFLLVTDNPNMLLDTVRSRCIELTDFSGDTEAEATEDAKEFFSLLESGSRAALLEAIAGMDRRDKVSREQLQSISSGVQMLAMKKLRSFVDSNTVKAAEYLRIISAFRRFDEYMAANVPISNLAGILLYEFVPLSSRTAK